MYNALKNIFTCCLLTTQEERPTSEILINDQKVFSLFDTGAMVTCASMKFYLSLRSRSPLQPYRHTLTAANGNEIKSRGTAYLRFNMGGYKFYHNVVILEDLRADSIIGVDLMKKHNLVLNMAQRKIYRCTKPIMDENKENIKPGGVAKKSFILEPLQAISVKLSNPLDGKEGQKYLVNGPHVPQGITEKDNDGKCVILVANKELTPIQIKRGERLCYFQPINEDDVVNNTEMIANIEKDIIRNGGGSWKGCGAGATFTESKVNKVNIIPDKDINAAITEVPIGYKERFASLVRSFSDIFSVDPDTVGCCDVYKQNIVLMDKGRVACKNPYRTAPNLTHIVESYVMKLLKQGVIENSVSPFNSPILLIKKPGNIDPSNLMSSYRLVHDFRLLNSNTIKQVYPLNHIFDLVDRVASGSVLSILDMASGYFNQMLTENSKKYTAFSVPSLGHFQYTRSAQGLKNSGPCFQKMLDFIISGIPDTYIFVDDIIISSKNMEDHIKALKLVFERFRQYGLKCRVSKVKFGAKSVQYLGWHITANTAIRPGELKTKAITDYKEPHSLRTLRGFLGICNFFRRCIPFYSQIAKPLTLLTRKDSTWQGGPLPAEAKNSFMKLKKLLTSRPCLRPIDFKKDFHITVDSSASGTGAVLSQIHSDGIEYPNMYISRSTDCSKKRSAFEIEASGLVWTMRQFRPIVSGGHCQIKTDHRPLSTLDRTSTPILDKIYAELEDFSFTMHYIPGKHMISDGLSRQEDHSKCKLCKNSEADLNVVSKAVKTQNRETGMAIDKTRVITPSDGAMENTSATLIDISENQIIGLQKEDYYVKALICYMKWGKLPDKPEFRQWVLRMYPKAKMMGGMVGIMVGSTFKILAPLNLRQTLLQLAHDHPLSGHFNWIKSMDKLKNWHWEGMAKEVEIYCKSCVKCNQNNPPAGGFTKMNLGKLPDVNKFNMRIHADLLGPLVSSGEEDYKYCLVITDAYSTFVRIIPLVNKSAQEVSKGLFQGWISTFSVPLSVTVDAGAEFKASITKELCKIMGSNITYSSVEHPMSNGMAERQMRNILSYIRKYINNNPNSWSSFLPSLMSALNTSLHTDKLVTPYELVFGYRPVGPANFNVRKYDYSEGGLSQLIKKHFELFQKVIIDKEKAYSRHKKQYEKNINAQNFSPNDIVYLKAPSRGMKLLPRYIGPLRVIALGINDNITMQHMLTGKTFHAHSNRVKFGSYKQQAFPDSSSHAAAYSNNLNGRAEGNSEVRTQSTPNSDQWEEGTADNNLYERMGTNLQRMADGHRPTTLPVAGGNRVGVGVGTRRPIYDPSHFLHSRSADDAKNALSNREAFKGPTPNVHNDTEAKQNFPEGPMTRARKKELMLRDSGLAGILSVIDRYKGAPCNFRDAEVHRCTSRNAVDKRRPTYSQSFSRLSNHHGFSWRSHAMLDIYPN